MYSLVKAFILLQGCGCFHCKNCFGNFACSTTCNKCFMSPVLYSTPDDAPAPAPTPNSDDQLGCLSSTHLSPECQAILQVRPVLACYSS